MGLHGNVAAVIPAAVVRPYYVSAPAAAVAATAAAAIVRAESALLIASATAAVGGQDRRVLGVRRAGSLRCRAHRASGHLCAPACAEHGCRKNTADREPHRARYELNVLQGLRAAAASHGKMDGLKRASSPVLPRCWGGLFNCVLRCYYEAP